MNSYEILHRLQAYRLGRPIPRGSTIHFPIAKRDDRLLLAFVRMGGESAPWGIAYKKGKGKLFVWTVPEPRNRDQLAEMAAKFAPVLLEHLSHPEHSTDHIVGPESAMPRRQIWIPNGSHLDMLHMLAFAYTFSRFGPTERRRLLNALGRACGWLFREAHRPGQVRIIDASAALRESFTFPAEDVRQRHTGFLLAWLEGDGDRDHRFELATYAERLTVATTLDPDFERTLEARNGAYNDARRDGNEEKQKELSREIHTLLEPELGRRIELIERSLAALERDPRPVNPGAIDLHQAGGTEQWYQYLRREHSLGDDSEKPAIAPSPSTDNNPMVAASRYHVHQASAERLYHSLVHHDDELQAEALAEGEAIFGTIVEVLDEGTGRSTIPVWVIEDEGELPLRLRERDRVCVAGMPKRWGVIRSIAPRGGGGRRFEIEIRGWKTRPRGPEGVSIPLAAAQSLEGISVRLLQTSGEDISHRKGQRTWNREVPGAWLTHHVSYHEGLPDDVMEEATA